MTLVAGVDSSTQSVKIVVCDLETGSATVDLTKAGFKPGRIIVTLNVGRNSFSVAVEPD